MLLCTVSRNPPFRTLEHLDVLVVLSLLVLLVGEELRNGLSLLANPSHC